MVHAVHTAEVDAPGTDAYHPREHVVHPAAPVVSAL